MLQWQMKRTNRKEIWEQTQISMVIYYMVKMNYHTSGDNKLVKKWNYIGKIQKPSEKIKLNP